MLFTRVYTFLSPFLLLERNELLPLKNEGKFEVEKFSIGGSFEGKIKFIEENFYV